MKKFLVTVSREWVEPGCVEVEADTPEEAREIVSEMLTVDSDEIKWNGSNMEPGKDEIEGVSEVSESPKLIQMYDTCDKCGGPMSKDYDYCKNCRDFTSKRGGR